MAFLLPGVRGIFAEKPPFDRWAVHLDGTDDHVSVGGFKPYTEIGTGDFTVSMRVKFDTVVGLTQRFFFMGRNTLDGVSAADYCMLTLNTSGQLGVTFRTGSSGVATDTWANVLGITQYYHLVFTRSGTTAKLYVNATERISVTDAEVGTALGASGSDTELLLGIFRDASSNAMDGYINEFALWKSVLTTGQITNIYRGEANGVSDGIDGTTGDLSSFSPYLWGRMGDNDGGAGTTVTDQGSAGFDMTLESGAAFEVAA